MKKHLAKKKKVLIALSGGIDSAVSAYLLIKQGYQVEAAFMKNWSSTTGLLKNECPWLIDRQDALRVAAFLRIPLHTLDFEKQYQNRVMKYFFDEYRKGRTPNPDVMCNKEIKFKLLYNWAMKEGFDYLATGHYARIHESRNMKHEAGRKKTLHASCFMLHRSTDEFKDQTYFIYNIKPNQLPHILFPVGSMKKSAVRSLAHKLKLPNAEKKESMGLCFVGKIRLKDFLEQKLKPKPGDIIDISTPLRQPVYGGAARIVMRGASRGAPRFAQRLPIHAALPNNESTIIGHHLGLHNYTIGQRQGIQVGAAGPYYVVKKNLKTNTLYVTNNPDDKLLMTKKVQIHSVYLVSKLISRSASASRRRDGSTDQPISLHGRYRHQGELVPLTIKKIAADNYQVTFKQPQKTVASGQSLVLYNKTQCLGGGIIA